MGGRGNKRERDERSYEKKESFKWQRACEQTCQRLGDVMDRIITFCDREADIYEHLTYKIQQAEGFVVRASWRRRVLNLEDGLDAAKVMRDAPKRGEALGLSEDEMCFTMRWWTTATSNPSWAMLSWPPSRKTWSKASPSPSASTGRRRSRCERTCGGA